MLSEPTVPLICLGVKPLRLTLPVFTTQLLLDVLGVTVEDVNSLREKECCADCNITYYYPNKEKWDKGWRPDIVRD